MEVYYKPNNFYEVEKIITKQKLKGKTYYLIKWEGYAVNESTWEPSSNLKNIQYMITNFEKNFPKSIDKELVKIFQNKDTPTKLVKSCETNLLKKKKLREKTIKNNLKKDFSEKKQNDELDLLKEHLYINIKKKNVEKENQENNSSKILIDLFEIESLETTSINDSQKESESGDEMIFKNLEENEQTNINCENYLIRPKILI